MAPPSRDIIDIVYPNISQLLGNVLVLAAGLSVTAVVAFSQLDLLSARRLILRRAAVLSVASAGMAACFAATHISEAVFLVPRLHPSVIAYYTIYSVGFGWAIIGLTVLLSKQLRLEPEAWRRVSLHLHRTVCAVVLLYLAGRLWSVGAYSVGLLPRWGTIHKDSLELVISTVLPLVALVLGTLGWLSRFWAPQFVKLIVRKQIDYRHQRLYRRLRPLWELIAQGNLKDLYFAERHQSSVSPTTRLCGRVFEICDIELRASRHVTEAEKDVAVTREIVAGRGHLGVSALSDAYVFARGVAAEQEPGKEKEKEKEKETPEVDAIPEMDIEAQARRLLRAYHALRAAPDLYRMLTSPPTDSDLSPTENQTTS
ncbi:DUF6545 domain-containing protein [Pseudonocardia sp. ICBG601]|uniref:DUF6545 domain-containing protein n=1 Tax=Pseudonocardia sp. ICBG601 TaxID=2846759 RepID=UPI001CF67808|nr:DUF6545 domain-containing protein [Pseudonocardia sp. ICBG601]